MSEIGGTVSTRWRRNLPKIRVLPEEITLDQKLGLVRESRLRKTES